jgi:hypothetical protein
MSDLSGAFLVAVRSVRFIIALIGIGLVAIIVTAIYTAWLPGDYFLAMVAEIDAEPPEKSNTERSLLGRAFRLSTRKDQAKAFPNYFFGPVETDIKRIFKSAVERCANHRKLGASLVSDFLGGGGFYLACGRSWYCNRPRVGEFFRRGNRCGCRRNTYYIDSHEHDGGDCCLLCAT